MKRTTNRLNHYLGRPSSRHLHAQIPKTFTSLLARERKVTVNYWIVLSSHFPKVDGYNGGVRRLVKVPPDDEEDPG